MELQLLLLLSGAGRVGGVGKLLLIVEVPKAFDVMGAELVLEHGQRLAALLVVVDHKLAEQIGRARLLQELLEDGVDVERLLCGALDERVALPRQRSASVVGRGMESNWNGMEAIHLCRGQSGLVGGARVKWRARYN